MKKVRRVVAILTVMVIVVLVIGTLICAITGSKYFFGMLFLTFAVPVVLWVFMWFTKLIYGESEVIAREDIELLSQVKTDADEDSRQKGNGASKLTP